MLEAMREAAAIAIASMTFPPLLNWAENAKSVAQHHRKDPRFATIGSTIGEIVRQHGYWRLVTTAINTSLAREVFYNTSRWMLYSHVRHIDMSLSERFAAAFGSGIVGSFIANPFDLVRVRQQSQAMDCQPTTGVEQYRRVISHAARRGSSNALPHLVLWSGWQVNCLRAGLFTSGSIVTYELCKGQLRKQWDEGPAVHIVSGLSMGVVALPLRRV